jgi:hypothetical protein
MRKLQGLITVLKIITIIALVFHLYGTHAKLLYQINPDCPKEIRDKGFHFYNWDEYTTTAKLFSIAYAIITAGILFIYSEHKKKLLVVLSFAILDAAGVYIYYDIGLEKFTIFAAGYYAAYTLAIIIAIGLHKTHVLNIDNRNILIRRMYDSGIVVRKIAELTDTSESTVQRIVKKSK